MKIDPTLYENDFPSKLRLEGMEWWIVEDGGSIPDGYDIDEIGWVTDRIGITDFEGSIKAVEEGHLTINVAGELESPAQVQIAIEPSHGTVQKSLDSLADLIQEQMEKDTTTKVVVHCAMGIERSPLTVVWYLYKYHCLTLDEAYALVRKARPVAAERRFWIEDFEEYFNFLNRG